MLIVHSANEQKLFYSLLLKYRHAQLENYTPDIGYSSSDYHHVRPLAMTKTYSTRHFPQPKSRGHGRQTSRFTVISNVAETEKSYDPFKASRPQHLNTIRVTDLPKVTIHRTRPSDDHGNAQSTSNYRQDSTTSFSFAGASDRSKYKKSARPRGYASRSSLASSTRSRGSASYMRASVGHKRGVSFTHLHNYRGLSKHHSNHTEVTDNDGDTLRPVAEHPVSTQYIRSRKTQFALSESIVLGPKPGRTSQIWKDDVRQLSSSLAKDCDEAFRIHEEAERAETQRRNSVRRSLSTGIKNAKESLLEVPSTRSKRSSWNDRPLPPSPIQSSSVKSELTEARKQAEIRKNSGGSDSPGYLDRVVSHIDKLMQPASPVTTTADRRSSSAPIDSKHGQPNRPMPSIFEARREEESPTHETRANIHSDRYLRSNVKNSRVASAPEPRDSSRGQDRFPRPDSDVRATIRVVNSESPVKAPAPLTIRKLSSRTGTPSLLNRSSGTDKASMTGRSLNNSRVNQEHSEEFVNDSNTGTILKKKSTWFKRNSKTNEEHDWRMSIGGVNATPSSSSGNDTSGQSHPGAAHLTLPIAAKKKFSLGRLFRKRSSKADMMALGMYNSVPHGTVG